MKLVALVTEQQRDDKFNPSRRPITYHSQLLTDQHLAHRGFDKATTAGVAQLYSGLTFRKPPRHGDTAAVADGKVGAPATISERAAAKCEE